MDFSIHQLAKSSYEEINKSKLIINKRFINDCIIAVAREAEPVFFNSFISISSEISFLDKSCVKMLS